MIEMAIRAASRGRRQFARKCNVGRQHSTRAGRHSADRPRGPAGDPPRRMDRADRRASRRATCRAISPSCRPRWPPTSCGSASSIPSPARCWRLGAPGDWRLPSLAEDLDIRTDLLPLPGVPQRRADRRADRHQASTGATTWSIFALGCSFSFEDALIAGRHRAAPHHLRHRPCRCTAPRSRPRRRARSTARWWCRCGR